MQYIAWAVIHLAALMLMLVAAAGAGHIFLRKFHFHSLLERWIFTIVLGLGVWALALFFLGIAGLLYRAVIVTLTTLIAIPSLWYFIRVFRKTFRPPDSTFWKSLLRSRNLLVLLIIAVGLSYWIILVRLPQYPPMSWDATAYHLVLAREYLLQHRVVAHEGMLLPVVPALNHLLFTWAMALKDDILAQLIEHVFMMLTALALYAWGKRQNKPGMGLALAAFWLGTPMVVFLGESGYVDMGIACFAFLGVYALRIFWDERRREWWYLALALLAMAGGIKLQGLFFLGLAGATGLWARYKSAISWRDLAGGWGIGLLVAIPWSAFIAYHTGNPFWPAAASLSTGVWKPGAEAVWLTWNHVGVEKTLLNFLLVPVRMAIDPAPFLPDANRAFLPLIILFPIAWIISFFSRSVRWWTLWTLAFTAFWFTTSQQLRFWIPAVPLAGLAVYESIQWMLDKTWKSAVFHGAIWMALALYAIQVGAGPSLEVVTAKGWPPPLTHEARDKFLVNSIPGYSGVKYINEHARDGDCAYSINGSWLNYYFEKKVIDVSGLLQIALHPTMRMPEDEVWLRQIESKNVKWVLVIYTNAPEVVEIPKRDPKLNPFWPDYELVYTDSISWVFRHKSVAGEAGETGVEEKSLSAITLNRARATPGVYRSSLSAYLLRNSNTEGNPDLAITFGVEGDIPIVGDWNGDGTVTVGVYRPAEATFYLRNTNTNGDPDILVPFGEPGDIPVVGDWDGDGATTVGVYRPGTTTFLLRNSNTAGEPDIVVKYGIKGDIPLAGDWAGKGSSTIGVYRPSAAAFLLRNSNTGGNPDLTISFGAAGEVPVVGDWDGNGTTTIGVYRPSTFEFVLRNSNSAGEADLRFRYGVLGDIPVVGGWEPK